MEDLINATFEAAASFFVLLHVRRVWLDKMVSGVSHIAVAFFTIWGFWNLYYYPALDQTFSFWASVILCLANIIYLASIIYWKRKG